jgi:hypothetical protein
MAIGEHVAVLMKLRFASGCNASHPDSHARKSICLVFWAPDFLSMLLRCCPAVKGLIPSSRAIILSLMPWASNLMTCFSLCEKGFLGYFFYIAGMLVKDTYKID